MDSNHPFRDGTDLRNHLCGGALLDSLTVITAAHCVDPRSTRNAVVNPEVHLGGTALDEPIQVAKICFFRFIMADKANGGSFSAYELDGKHQRWTRSCDIEIR